MQNLLRSSAKGILAGAPRHLPIVAKKQRFRSIFEKDTRFNNMLDFFKENRPKPEDIVDAGTRFAFLLFSPSMKTHEEIYMYINFNFL